MCSLRALGGAVGVEAERTFYCSRNSHVAVAAVVVAAVVVAAVVAVVAVVVVVVAAAAAAWGRIGYVGHFCHCQVHSVQCRFRCKLAPLVWKENLSPHRTYQDSWSGISSVNEY